MTAYLIRRLGTSIVILIGISIFVFVLLHSVFPSPAVVVLGPKATPRAVAVWNAFNGSLIRLLPTARKVCRPALVVSPSLDQQEKAARERRRPGGAEGAPPLLGVG